MDNQSEQPTNPSAETPVSQTVTPPPSKSFLLNKLILIVIILTFLLGGGILARHYFVAYKEKPSIPEREARNDFNELKNFTDRSGLIFKKSPTSTVEKIRVAGTQTAFSIPEDKIEIRLLHNPLPEGEGIFVSHVGYEESIYFSLPGTFNWETSPIYNFSSYKCVGAEDCNPTNPLMKSLPPKRYEITNVANQKVGIVRYIAMSNKATCISCDTILSFEKRYILDFDTVTIWVKFGEPLLISNPIPNSNTSKKDVQDFIQNSIDKLKTDANLEEKFRTSDEFIRQISIDKNGYEFFNMTGSISNNLCTPCKVEIQGLRMKLTQERGGKTSTEILEPKDVSWLKNDPTALENVVGKFKPIISSVEIKEMEAELQAAAGYRWYYFIRGKNLAGSRVHFNDSVFPDVSGGNDYIIEPVSEAILPKGNYQVFIETLFGESNKLNKKVDI